MKERIRVLIIDDDSSIINTLKNYLLLDREHEFIIDYESLPDRALSSIKKFQPHVVLLDNQFADKKVGIDELLPRIAGQFPEVKVIVVTGHRGSDTDQIMRALGWNAAGFLDKPNLGPEVLRAKVLEAFKAYQQKEKDLE